MELKLTQRCLMQRPDVVSEKESLLDRSGNDIELNEEQNAALEIMSSGRNVFVTGEAGTGKSTLLREFIRQRGDHCLVLAPTGIAAINAGGTTIHSQMLFKPGLLNPHAIEPLNDSNRCRVLRSAPTVVVDEISMVRSDLFCAMDKRLREIASGDNRVRPFGGRQVILVGDFMQLPPVVSDAEERKFLVDRLGGVFAFETDLWQAAMFHTVFLRTVHRQQGDRVFRNVLNDIRAGAFEAAAKILNNNCHAEKRFHSPPVCLCTTNREALFINEAERKRLVGEKRNFMAEVSGIFAESDYPVEENLELVVGARVMVLCNQRIEGLLECVNGDRGTVVGFGEDDEHLVCVRLDNGKEVELVPHTWEKIVYACEADEKTQTNALKQVVTGSFTQIPLRLAYAITVYKSQGLSMDAVDLRLGLRGCFDHGQLYTALSRCRTLSGLRIDRFIRSSDLIIDDAVVKFYSSITERNEVISRMSDQHWYDEAMKFYLRRLETGNGEPKPSGMRQFEFDFSPRVNTHPTLDKLQRLYVGKLINKYDLPVLSPFVKELADGMGGKKEDLVYNLIEKYSILWLQRLKHTSYLNQFAHREAVGRGLKTISRILMKYE